MQFYKSKLKSNKDKIAEIEMQNIALEENIDKSLELTTKIERVIGIDINSIRLLACHSCGEDLLISDAAIEDNNIVSGNLICSCGTKYSIKDGIIIAEKFRGRSTS